MRSHPGLLGIPPSRRVHRTEKTKHIEAVRSRQVRNPCRDCPPPSRNSRFSRTRRTTTTDSARSTPKPLGRPRSLYADHINATDSHRVLNPCRDCPAEAKKPSHYPEEEGNTDRLCAEKAEKKQRKSREKAEKTQRKTREKAEKKQRNGSFLLETTYELYRTFCLWSHCPGQRVIYDGVPGYSTHTSVRIEEVYPTCTASSSPSAQAQFSARLCMCYTQTPRVVAETPAAEPSP